MAITKGSGTSVIPSTTSTTTSGAQSVSSNYLTEVFISYAQSSTAATVAATFQIKVSPDGGTTYYSPASLLVTAPLTASATTNWVIAIPTTATNYEVVYTAPTTGTGTAVVQSNDVTAV